MVESNDYVAARESPRHAPAITQSRGLINNIQALRALAALLVVLYHLRSWSSIGSFDWTAGQAGVDIFFVISGFIIGHVTMSERDVGRFLVRRLIRIVPLYWALTLLVFMAAHAKPGLLSPIPPTLSDLALSLAFIPYAPAEGAVSPLLFLGWTLNFEMFFYILFALCMAVSHRWRIEFAAAVICLLVAIGVAVRPSGAALEAYTNPLMLEFVGGLLLSRWFAGFEPERSAMAANLCAAGCAVMLALILCTGSAVDTVPRVLVWGAPALCLVLLALAAEKFGLSASGSIVLLLGGASYAIYLVHPFIIKVVGGGLAFAGDALVVLVALAVIIAVSVLVHLAFERPVTKALTARLAR